MRGVRFAERTNRQPMTFQWFRTGIFMENILNMQIHLIIVVLKYATPNPEYIKTYFCTYFSFRNLCTLIFRLTVHVHYHIFMIFRCESNKFNFNFDELSTILNLRLNTMNIRYLLLFFLINVFQSLWVIVFQIAIKRESNKNN